MDKDLREILTKRVSAAGNVLMQELENEAVILNLDTEDYYSLDDVGMRMWQVLTAGGTVQEAFHTLQEEYDVPAEILEQDLKHFIGKLSSNGLILIEET